MTGSALLALADDPSSRKRFFKAIGGAGAAGACSALLAGCGGGDKTVVSAGPPAVGTAGDLKIVNDALTLEYLEADLYSRVLDSGEISDRATLELVRRFGATEQEHVDALKATAVKLGGRPVGKPRTRFQEIIAKGPRTILRTAATLENLGAAAYLAQLPNITAQDVLAAALAIHSVEARHAAALNALAGRGFSGDGPLVGSLPDGAFARPMDMRAVLAAAAPYMAG